MERETPQTRVVGSPAPAAELAGEMAREISRELPREIPREMAREVAHQESPARRRVVVACSETQVSELIESVLSHHGEDIVSDGLEVRRVADGLTCLQAIELDRPDLIILHARLDRMTPLEILEAWDRSHPGDRLPAIVLSAAFGSDVPRGLSGAAVVNLPFDNGHLVDVVTRALTADDIG